MDRSPRLQRLLDAFAEKYNIPQDFLEDFAEATNHAYNCRCAKCKVWWEKMGNEEEGYGPFTREELELDQRS